MKPKFINISEGCINNSDDFEKCPECGHMTLKIKMSGGTKCINVDCEYEDLCF